MTQLFFERVGMNFKEMRKKRESKKKTSLQLNRTSSGKRTTCRFQRNQIAQHVPPK